MEFDCFLAVLSEVIYSEEHPRPYTKRKLTAKDDSIYDVFI